MSTTSGDQISLVGSAVPLVRRQNSSQYSINRKPIEDAIEMTGCAKLGFVVSLIGFGLGLAEIVLASEWQHSAGVAAAAVLVFLAVILPCVEARTHIPRQKWRFGASKALGPLARAVLITLRCLTFASFAFVLTFVIIRIAGSDAGHEGHAFPEKCVQRYNCARLTDSNATDAAPARVGVGEDLELPTFNATLIDTLQAMVEVSKNLAQTEIMYENHSASHNLLHLRSVSGFFGFPDDTWITVVCKNGQAQVWLQGEARLGRSDLGVNLKRLREIVAAINAAPPAKNTCVS